MANTRKQDQTGQQKQGGQRGDQRQQGQGQDQPQRDQGGRGNQDRDDDQRSNR